MKKQRVLPLVVQKAIYEGNIPLLSYLGKRGAEKKGGKEKRKKLQQKKYQIMLEGCYQMAEQANEHICPVND